MRRWRRCCPFQGRRVPWIIRCDFAAVFDAPKEIHDERNLSEPHQPSGCRDWNVPTKTGYAPDLFAGETPALATIVPTPMHPEHPLEKHREKNHVHQNERRPKMHFAPKLVHHSSSSFGKPI